MILNLFVIILLILLSFQGVAFAQNQPEDAVAPEQEQPETTQSTTTVPTQTTGSTSPAQTSSKVVSSTISCVKVGSPDESLKSSVCKETQVSQLGEFGPVLREYCGDEDLQGNPVLCYKPAYVYYCQGDPRWATTRNLINAGCGPTSMAMVLSSFGDTINPPDMDAIFAQRGWRSDPKNGSLMQTAIQTYLPEIGYEYHALGAPMNLPKAQEYLNAGYLIIGSTTDHIFVIDGVDPAQNILRLRDPGRCEYKDGVYRSASAPWGGQSMTYSYAVKKKAN